MRGWWCGDTKESVKDCVRVQYVLLGGATHPHTVSGCLLLLLLGTHTPLSTHIHTQTHSKHLHVNTPQTTPTTTIAPHRTHLHTCLVYDPARKKFGTGVAWSGLNGSMPGASRYRD